jgi:hypothetical protein
MSWQKKYHGKKVKRERREEKEKQNENGNSCQGSSS